MRFDRPQSFKSSTFAQIESTYNFVDFSLVTNCELISRFRLVSEICGREKKSKPTTSQSEALTDREISSNSIVKLIMQKVDVGLLSCFSVKTE